MDCKEKAYNVDYLKPLFTDLKKLEQCVRLTDYLSQSFTCKAALLTCTCDLPAKSLVTNSIQFNGKYGCWRCLQPGEPFHTQKGGICHILPYNDDDPCGPKRSLDSIRSDVQEGSKQN